MQTSKGAPSPASDDAAPPPAGSVAAALVEAAAGCGAHLHLAEDERAAEVLAALARGLAPELEVVLFPPWDCLPYDHASPSLQSQGGRVAALLALAQPAPAAGRLVVTSPEALVQKTLRPDTLGGLGCTVGLHRPGEVDAVARYAHRTGYRLVEEVVEAGEVCQRGEVLDIFPAACPEPRRLEVAPDGAVIAIHGFDPATQLTTHAVDALALTPASELIAPEEGADPAIFPERGGRPAGVEHELPRLCGPLVTLLDHLPADWALSLAPDAPRRLVAQAEQAHAAFETAEGLARDGGRSAPPRPDALYLDAKAAAALLAGRKPVALKRCGSALPHFALGARPLRDAVARMEAVLGDGGVCVMAGAPVDLKRLAHAVEARSGRRCRTVHSWAEVQAAEPGDVLCYPLDLPRGFERRDPAILVLAASDVLGARAHQLTHATAASALEMEPELHFGDVVIHQDHGVGLLEGLEVVETGGERRAAARIAYHDGAVLLVPAHELGRVWRYGAEPGAVTLDRLNTQGWLKKRAEVEASIAGTAEELVRLSRQRDSAEAPRISPPRQAYERFTSRFPYPLTQDQRAAVEAVMADLSSGRPMNRLVCGDVGFGKTEVAMRAAAAVALSGRQVAICAPTTVLARQHLLDFQRRFEAVGLEVGHLSRLAKPAEAKATKAGLKAGDIPIVVATHALAAKDVAFKDLGLLIIDEEQRFGAKLKEALHAMAPHAHVLTLTATPIPRTLQAALVGIQDISVIATPPARRRPVRTLVAPYDPAAVKTALERERARGGQSFVVTPRIEDIEPLRADLAELVPQLKVRVAHGQLAPAEVDEVMVGFADGDGDVLLATNIIESGMNVPRANTMLVHHPDRFGLAQLHQLRGRVGRGRVQASAYLLHDPAHPLSEDAQARLETLAALDRLGAGLAISARDLDLRGAGDLVGEDQAGHLKLIGVGLYQWLLARAVRQARGEAVDDRPEPELAFGEMGELPDGYVPNPQTRLNLYARLCRMPDAEAVRRFSHELEDRFGPPPPEVSRLLERARIARSAHQLGVLKVAAGPKGLALDFIDAATARRLAAAVDGAALKDARLVVRPASGGAGLGGAGLAERLDALLEALLDADGEADAARAHAAAA